MGRSKHIREESLVFVVADPDLARKVFWKAAPRVREGALPMRSLSSVLITSSICDLTPPSSPPLEGEPRLPSLCPCPILYCRQMGKSETSIIPVNTFGHVEHLIIH